MPLQPCPECGIEASTLAAACPKCGAPIAKPVAKMPLVREWVGWIIALLAGADMLSTCLGSGHSADAKLGGTVLDGLFIGFGVFLILSGRRKRGK